jgi:NAD kinase
MYRSDTGDVGVAAPARLTAYAASAAGPLLRASRAAFLSSKAASLAMTRHELAFVRKRSLTAKGAASCSAILS